MEEAKNKISQALREQTLQRKIHIIFEEVKSESNIVPKANVDFIRAENK